MLTREVGSIKVRAMEQYISIPQKKRTRKPAAIKERLDYPTVESYLEEVVNPVKNES